MPLRNHEAWRSPKRIVAVLREIRSGSSNLKQKQKKRKKPDLLFFFNQLKSTTMTFLFHFISKPIKKFLMERKLHWPDLAIIMMGCCPHSIYTANFIHIPSYKKKRPIHSQLSYNCDKKKIFNKREKRSKLLSRDRN